MSQNVEPLTRLKQNLEAVVVARPEVFDLLLVALLSKGHVLIEDVPGVGKTTLARCLARSLSLEFRRLQLTPDLLPSDLIGSSVYNPSEARFLFHKGPLFTDLLLADELNRATPRTQSALLEAMQEGQVSADGTTHILNEAFMVIATQNPIELQGTFPLPEAQRDRFALAVSLGYPDTEGQVRMLSSRLHEDPFEELEPVVSREELHTMQDEAQCVEVHRDLLEYATTVGEETRRRPEVALGASPRALLSWVRAAQALAYLRGRLYARPRDFIELAEPVLAHRISLMPEVALEGRTARESLRDVLDSCVVPVALTEG